MLRVSHLDMESAKFKADVAERLHAARKALGMTQKDLADQADVPIPSLRDYERGSSSPGAEAMAKFARVGISPQWLLCGAENADHAPSALLFRTSFLRYIGAQPWELVLVRVRGDSMHPTLHAGWTVMLDTTRTNVSSGVYVVSLAGDEVCKRLEARPGGVVRVISDNRLYEEYDIDLATVGDDFMVIGKVIWFAGLIT